MNFRDFVKNLVAYKNNENLKKEIGLLDFNESKVEDWIEKMKEVAKTIYEKCVKGNENDYDKMSEKLYEFLDSLKDEKKGKSFFKFNGTDYREQEIKGLNKKLGELKRCDPITFYNLLIGSLNRLELLNIDLGIKSKSNPFGIPFEPRSIKIFPSSNKDFENSWKLFLSIYKIDDDYSKAKEVISGSEFKDLLKEIIDVEKMELIKLSQVLYLMKPQIFTALQNKGREKLNEIIIDFKDFKETKSSEKIDYYIHTILDTLHEDGVKLTKYPTVWFSRFIYDITRKSEESLNNLKNLIKADLFVEKIMKLLYQKKQVILYGPPGTGKTYLAKKIAEEFVKSSTEKDERIKFITFHPSYSYEEFIEGIKPRVHEEKIVFRVEEGIFKRFCREALNALLKEAEIKKEWKESKELSESKSNANETKGLPVFSEEERKEVKKLIQDPEKTPKFVLVIDEINRGDISKIFGELITLLESDKRLFAENEIICDLPYSKEKFGIPPNLYIIGTMNSTDRSIALVDIALRRRFRFIEIEPSYLVLMKELLNINDVKSEEAIKEINNEKDWNFEEKEFEQINNEDIKKLAIKVLYALNDRIKRIYNKDYQIGHSYILRLKDLNKEEELISELKNIWYYEILPLLNEYFYENEDKLREVLNNAFLKTKTDGTGFDFVFFKENKEFIENLKAIIK
jgi:MoxR-like ATPase